MKEIDEQQNPEVDNTPDYTYTNNSSNDTVVSNTEDSDIESSPTPPESIKVHITDKTSPIVLLFGAPASGKTMTIVRLCKYLRSKGYDLAVDKNFCRNAWEYNKNANRFNSMLDTQDALKGTNHNDFLLIKVIDKKGSVICQILEGAGEDYFARNEIEGYNREEVPFPNYMADVFGSPNKKVWVFLTEPDWNVEHEDKTAYVRRIEFCKKQCAGVRDKHIILFNKIDKTATALDSGRVHVKNAFKMCKDEYPGLFDIFKNLSPLPWKSKYSCRFVPFSTGNYGMSISGSSHYSQSADAHPIRLWKAILKSIKG